jgi:membrane protease YdiL (CAAX protease family)
VLLSNIFLVLVDGLIINSNTSVIHNNLFFRFIFFNTVRILGEEFIFRGFLLIKDIKKDNTAFWVANIIQAVILVFYIL